MAAPTSNNEVTARRLSRLLVGADGNGGLWGKIKGKLAGKSDLENGVYYVAGTTDYPAWVANHAYAVNDNVVSGGRAYYCTTAHTSGSSFNSSKWAYIATPVIKGNISGVTALYSGLKIALKWPITGGTSSTYLNINGLGNFYIRRNNSNMTTHVPVNTVTFLAYDGSFWQWADYDSDAWVTTMGAYCTTGSSTAAKLAASSSHVYTAGETFLIRFTNSNTAASKLTLSVNSQGTRDVWINGAVSSSSNYNIPAGEHWCHYDGSVFHIWTDGTAQFKNVAAKSYKGLEYTDGENIAYQIFKAGSPNTAKSSDSKSITITPEDRDTHFSVKLTEAVAATDIIAVSMDVEYTGSDDGNWYWPFSAIGQTGGITMTFTGSGHYAFTGTAGISINADEYALIDDNGRVANRLPANSFTIRNIKIERGGTATGFRLCKKEQTPPSHTHGNIANGGTLTDTAAAAAGNDYVVIRDADNAKIQTSTIKGTDVADAVSKKHSHSTLTLSTTAQAYDGSHTLALPSTDPYTSARTPASHTHGNIANGGTLTDTAAAAAGNDYVVIRDADNAKVQTSTIKGTDVADAVSKKHSHSTLTLSTTAQAYDGSHTLALPSTDPYTSARTPASHTHGNIQNGGTLQTSDITIAYGDRLVVTDASDSNKVARASVSFDGSSTGALLSKAGTFQQPKEAYLTWGGQNLSSGYGPIDAAMVSDLGANRLMFGNGAGVTVEYTRDGGTTWTDYGLATIDRSAIFSIGYSIRIGKSDSTNNAIKVGTDNYKNYKVRVTITTNSFGVYTQLNKFVIYCSTSGSQGPKVTLTARTKANKDAGNDTWTNCGSMTLGGWPGYNVLNTSNITTYGNQNSHFQELRFLFEDTVAPTNTGNEQYLGLSIIRIMGFGGVGWQTPSNMASTGHLYTYDASQNATFPAKVSATEFIGPIVRTLATSGTIAETNLLTVTGSTDAFKLTYACPEGNKGLVKLYTIDDGNETISIGNYVSSTYKEAISVTNGSATITGSLTGTASTAKAYDTSFTGTNSIKLALDGKQNTLTVMTDTEVSDLLAAMT